MDGKKSTIDALKNYLTKDLKSKEPKKKRTKPEKTVEHACVNWMKGIMGWSVEIYNSSSTYNPFINRWINQGMKAGTADCMGVMPDGRAVAVEFKAPKKLFTICDNERQLKFIEMRVKQNAFAVVVDSLERLQLLYYSWLKIESADKKREFLMNNIPRRNKNKNRFRPPE